jgi:hypothetical protein
VTDLGNIDRQKCNNTHPHARAWLIIGCGAVFLADQQVTEIRVLEEIHEWKIMISINSRLTLSLIGWVLAAVASVALILQHIKWREQQALWQSQLNEQHERVVELELIIAELHTDLDQGGPGLNRAAAKTSSAISNVLERVRERLSRGAPAE